MARKPHLAKMLDEQLRAYKQALQLEIAAVMAETELRNALDKRSEAERERAQLELPWDEPDEAA